MPKGQGGRQPRKALTARFVETVNTPGKHFDGNGLYLRVAPNGSRQWVQRIMIQGKRTEIGLGSPPAISLAVARKQALENKGAAMQGGNPLANRQRARSEITFEESVETYLATKLSEFKNEKHRKQWRSTLDTYATPLIGPKKVSRITVQDIVSVLQPIWYSKTETATRLRGRIENVLSWATVAGHRDGENPARWQGNLSELLPKPTKVAKADKQPAVAVADMPRWWRTLGMRKGMAAQALRFLTLTAARSGEIRGMTWDEVALEDAQGPVWTIPGDRMKNERLHRVPLSASAVEILASLPELEGSPHVFFAPKGGMLSDMSLSKVMRAMQAAEEKDGRPGFLDPESRRPAVPHGLRSTFRQWAAEQGFPRDMAELALAHWIGSEVERAYQRADMLERRRDMMQAWAEFVTREM